MLIVIQQEYMFKYTVVVAFNFSFVRVRMYSLMCDDVSVVVDSDAYVCFSLCVMIMSLLSFLIVFILAMLNPRVRHAECRVWVRSRKRSLKNDSIEIFV